MSRRRLCSSVMILSEMFVSVQYAKHPVFSMSRTVSAHFPCARTNHTLETQFVAQAAIPVKSSSQSLYERH
jgi:hypothetical protein